jgi:3-hydroxyisobutyrate dehydrogenase-like beta-hydroxyacid dehydrogenase
VTVLGLGPMGQALAAAFLAHGHPTTVWNRTPEKADALVAAGATRADSVAEAVAAGDLVVVCVIDYPAVHAIVDRATDALAGRTLVNLTADSPDSAREMAAWAAREGVEYLEGTIMSPTVTIDTPEAVLLFSGPEQLYDRHRETLASLGGSHTYLGADTSSVASAAAGMAHVIHAAETRGLDTSVLRAAHAVARRVIDAGHGDDSVSRLTGAVTIPS